MLKVKKEKRKSDDLSKNSVDELIYQLNEMDTVSNDSEGEEHKHAAFRKLAGSQVKKVKVIQKRNDRQLIKTFSAPKIRVNKPLGVTLPLHTYGGYLIPENEEGEDIKNADPLDLLDKLESFMSKRPVSSYTIQIKNSKTSQFSSPSMHDLGIERLGSKTGPLKKKKKRGSKLKTKDENFMNIYTSKIAEIKIIENTGDSSKSGERKKKKKKSKNMQATHDQKVMQLQHYLGGSSSNSKRRTQSAHPSKRDYFNEANRINEYSQKYMQDNFVSNTGDSPTGGFPFPGDSNREGLNDMVEDK